MDDLASAVVHLLINYTKKDPNDIIVNVGCGKEISIKDLAGKISRIVGYTGCVTWDGSKPDGTPRKLLSVDKLRNSGWKPQIDLDTGIQTTYEWYLSCKKKH